MRASIIRHGFAECCLHPLVSALPCATDHVLAPREVYVPQMSVLRLFALHVRQENPPLACCPATSDADERCSAECQHSPEQCMKQPLGSGPIAVTIMSTMRMNVRALMTVDKIVPASTHACVRCVM